MRIGVSLLSAGNRLIAGQTLIYKESSRGPRNPQRVGDVAKNVV